MDLTPILTVLISMSWYLVPFFLIGTVMNSSWFKGKFGEFVVNLSVKLFLNQNDYHLIKNVTLPTEDGTTQIDHIIVSKYGVFVVETKNVKGWIFGSQSQKQWTQKIYKHTSKFQNPLHQNYKHVKTLESLLDLNEEQLHSVIIFAGNCTLKTEMPENVTQGIGFTKYIKSKSEQLLTENEVIDVISKIEGGRLVSSIKTDRAHAKHVKRIVEEKEDSKTCTKCGNSMEIREAKKGQNIGQKFWGCSSFPKCRNIMAL